MTDATIRALPRLERLEQEITRTQELRHHPAPVEPEPDLGKLSAEAVLAQWEETAKEVEGLGGDVKDRIEKLQAALNDCHDDLKLIGEAAKHVRAKGETIFNMLSEAASLSKIMRDTCADFSKKVGA